MTVITDQLRVQPIRASDLLDPATAPFWISHAGTPYDSVAPIRDVRVERYWPLKDGGLSIEWSFVADEGRRKLFGRLHRGGKLSIHSLDDDPRLLHLSDCLDPGLMADRIVHATSIRARQNGGVIHRAGELRVTAELLAYRAGRRATILYDSASGNSRSGWVAKVFRDGRANALARLHSAVNEQLRWITGGRVRTTSPVGIVDDLNLILFDRVRGGVVDGRNGLSSEHARRTATALAALHRCQPPGIKFFGPLDEISVLQRWFRIIEWVDPACTARWCSTLEGIERLASDADVITNATVHRDCYNAQFLQTQRTTTIIDLDTLAKGDPAIDLGNWIAHARLSAARFERLGNFGQVCRDLVSTYRRTRSVSDTSLRLFTASAAMRLAMVHAFRSSTRAYSDDLATFAQQVCNYDAEFEW